MISRDKLLKASDLLRRYNPTLAAEFSAEAAAQDKISAGLSSTICVHSVKADKIENLQPESSFPGLHLLAEIFHRLHPALPYELEIEQEDISSFSTSVEISTFAKITTFPSSQMDLTDDERTKFTLARALLLQLIEPFDLADDCPFCDKESDTVHDIECPVWKAKVLGGGKSANPKLRRYRTSKRHSHTA